MSFFKLLNKQLDVYIYTYALVITQYDTTSEIS